MSNATTKSFFILLLVFTLSCEVAFSQNSNRFGFSLKEEKNSSSPIRTSVGASFEKLLGKHNSFQIEVNYRTLADKFKTIASIDGSTIGSVDFVIRWSFLSIPLLYGYKSNFINLSVGPSLDLYLNWKETKHVASPPSFDFGHLQWVQFDKGVHLGVVAKASKTIKLGRNVLTEPGVYFNPVFTPYNVIANPNSMKLSFYGISLEMKYIL